MQGSNGGDPVFTEQNDFRHYSVLLRESSERYSLEILAYCLMPTQVHFVCIPKADGALSRCFNALHMRYAQYFRGKRGPASRLWKSRFRSCMIDDPSVYEEIRFIENLPVRASLAAKAEEYPWSSARCHVMGGEDPLVKDHSPFKDRVACWPAYLEAHGNEPVLEKTRKCLRTGRPAGDTEWVRKLETVLGRRLEALPRGRPKKASSSPSSVTIDRRRLA